VAILTENRMTSTPSPPGRRILVAVVTGAVGERIQAWRRKHDPEQAERLPPHATLCYWAPIVEAELLEQQVRHAFPERLNVGLGGVLEGDNDQETFYVEMLDTERLEEAQSRLYDGTHVSLPASNGWLWHVTCVRDSRARDKKALAAAAQDLQIDEHWTLDTISYMELSEDGRYQAVATWRIA
jgi:2'-5' RNA ligase superfamily